MNQLISKWNDLMEQKNKLAKEEKALLKELKNAGFLIVGDEIIENTETLGLFWSLDYCSHYVGEHGMYRDITTGASKISSEEFEQIQNCLHDLNSDETTGTLSQILSEYIPLSDYIYSNMLEKGKATIMEDQAKWVTTEKGTNDGQMSPGSYFEVKKTTSKEIHAVKYIFQEDICT